MALRACWKGTLKLSLVACVPDGNVGIDALAVICDATMRGIEGRNVEIPGLVLRAILE